MVDMEQCSSTLSFKNVEDSVSVTGSMLFTYHALSYINSLFFIIVIDKIINNDIEEV